MVRVGTMTVLLGLACATSGCEPSAPVATVPYVPAVMPRLSVGDNVRWSGKVKASPVGVRFQDIAADSMLSHWRPPNGLLLAPGQTRLGLCGTPFIAHKAQDANATVHGRVIVFQARSDGSGPAGRGDYLMKIDDSAIESARGGRLAMRYESYLSSGSEFYAWIAILSDRPLACDCPSFEATCNEPVPDPPPGP